MPELTHMLNVVYGEGVNEMPRENVSVDPTVETTLYSGRIARIWDGEAKEGRTGPEHLLFVVHEGVDRPDVAGVSAVASHLTGSVMGENAMGVCSLVPLGDRLRIQTTEFDSNLTYAEHDPVTCSTGNGVWRKATAWNGVEVLGYVAAEPSEVIDGLEMLDIRVTGRPLAS